MKDKDLSFSYLDKFKVYYSFKQGKKTYIFLHGIGGCKNNFVKAFDYIKNKNVGVLTIDLPGFGKSKMPKKFKIKSVISLHVEILNRLIKKLKIEKTILVVFSLATCYLPAIKNQKFWSPKIRPNVFGFFFSTKHFRPIFFSDHLFRSQLIQRL